MSYETISQIKEKNEIQSTNIEKSYHEIANAIKDYLKTKKNDITVKLNNTKIDKNKAQIDELLNKLNDNTIIDEISNYLDSTIFVTTKPTEYRENLTIYIADQKKEGEVESFQPFTNSIRIYKDTPENTFVHEIFHALVAKFPLFYQNLMGMSEDKMNFIQKHMMDANYGESLAGLSSLSEHLADKISDKQIEILRINIESVDQQNKLSNMRLNLTSSFLNSTLILYPDMPSIEETKSCKMEILNLLREDGKTIEGLDENDIDNLIILQQKENLYRQMQNYCGYISQFIGVSQYKNKKYRISEQEKIKQKISDKMQLLTMMLKENHGVDMKKDIKELEKITTDIYAIKKRKDFAIYNKFYRESHDAYDKKIQALQIEAEKWNLISLLEKSLGKKIEANNERIAYSNHIIDLYVKQKEMVGKGYLDANEIGARYRALRRDLLKQCKLQFGDPITIDHIRQLLQKKPGIYNNKRHDLLDGIYLENGKIKDEDMEYINLIIDINNEYLVLSKDENISDIT